MNGNSFQQSVPPPKHRIRRSVVCRKNTRRTPELKIISRRSIVSNVCVPGNNQIWAAAAAAAARSDIGVRRVFNNAPTPPLRTRWSPAQSVSNFSEFRVNAFPTNFERPSVGVSRTARSYIIIIQWRGGGLLRDVLYRIGFFPARFGKIKPRSAKNVWTKITTKKNELFEEQQ